MIQKWVQHLRICEHAFDIILGLSEEAWKGKNEPGLQNGAVFQKRSVSHQYRIWIGFGVRRGSQNGSKSESGGVPKRGSKLDLENGRPPGDFGVGPAECAVPGGE